MPDNTFTIEVLSAPGCNQCGKAFQMIQTVVAKLDLKTIHLHQVNVIDELDYAVTLGLRATPGIVMNGKLVFTRMPTENALQETIVYQYSQYSKSKKPES